MPGRNFELALTLDADVLRIEVSDTRGERRPPAPGMATPSPAPFAESGRGLLLVQAVASRWEVRDRPPIGKTIVAELPVRL